MSICKKIFFIFILFFIIPISAQQFEIKHLNIDDGLPSNNIFDIKQDQMGYIWIATDKGLVKFDGNDFKQINTFKTNSLFIDNNTIYSGLDSSLFIKNKSKEKLLKSKKVIKLFSFNNEIFVGTSQGVYHLKENILEPIKINSILDFSIINDIIYCKESYYIASNSGLWMIDELLNPKKIIKISEEENVYLLKFQEKIISATLQNGLLLIDGESVEKKIETLENISSIKKLKNEIWVTSKSNGIEVFVLPSFSFKQKINKYNSLKTNAINTVFKDKQQTIYIATNNGLYLRTDNKLNYSNHKPSVYFKNLLVNHQNIDSLLLEKNVTFLNTDNNISISFKSVDILNPKKIKYRYKFIGDFSPWSKNNTVQFANLTARKYKFQIQSKNDNKESAIKSFSFTIDEPFYKKAWFNFSLVISLLLIGYFFVDYYIKNVNKKNKEKLDKLKLQNSLLTLEQKALQLQMNPHFIFNVLNGIKALGNSNKIEELNATISKFSLLLRGILTNSRKEEISLQEEIDLLKNYIELEQKMSSKSFTYIIKTNLDNIDADEILIPTMLLQPFIENCIQHAFQNDTLGEIIINFYVKHRFLHCAIKDNGIGIKKSKKNKINSNHKSVALNVSKERLHIISPKSNFSIEEIYIDNKINGSNIHFRIPLKTDF